MTSNSNISGTRREPAKRVRFTPAVLEMKAPKVGCPRIERRDDLSPLWLRITPSGDRSFGVRVRIKGDARPVRLTYSERAHISNLTAAREWAVKTDGQARAGIDPRAEKRALDASAAAQKQRNEESEFEKVALEFLATNGVFKRNSQPWRPRTAAAYEYIVRQKLLPRFKGRIIHSISRDEISDLLTDIADTAPVVANRTLSVVSAMMGWYQTLRGANYTSPIVRGMAPAEETARERILNDGEIRIVWHVAGKAGTYGGIVREILLTAARRGEAAAMRRTQIGQDGIWALPGESTKNHLPLYLPLSADALGVIAAQPQIGQQDLVFSANGKVEFDNWSRSKETFDKRILLRLRAIARASGNDPGYVAPLPNWTLHDLRRTARSLMSRAKVRPDHAERVLNHKIRGVEGTYDRHSYEDEKRDALERLARVLRQIIEGESAKIVQFPTRAAAE